MAYPRYIGKSAFASGTGALTVAALTGTQAGDIIILFAESANETITTPTGYSVLATQVGTGTAGAAGAVRIASFYRIIGDAADTSTTVADSGDHTTAIKMLFRDTSLASGGGFFVTATSTQGTASTSMTFPAVTTATDESLVVLAVGIDLDANSTTAVSNFANANLANIAQRHSQTVAAGQGGGLAVYTGEKATAGSTGTSTATGSTSVVRAYHTISFSRIADQTTTTDFINLTQSSTAYFPISDAMRITAGADGIVSATSSGTFTPTPGGAGTEGSYGLNFKWYYRQLGTDTWTASTAQASTVNAVVAGGNVVTIGSFTDNETITGLTNNIEYEFVLFAARQSLPPTGDVSFSATARIAKGYKVTADGGTYTYAGTDATLTYTTIGAYTLTADSGTYSYTGTDAAILYNRIITADSESYSYAGTAATLTYATVGAFVLNADSGSYSYAGTDASVLFNSKLVADGGSYSYSGTDATLTYAPVNAYAITADPGLYSYLGSDATILFNRKVIVDSGSYSYVGSDAALTIITAIQFPTYIGEGTFTTSTVVGQSPSPPLPSGIQNGDLIIAVLTYPVTSTPSSSDSKWTRLASVSTGTSGTAGCVGVSVFYATYSGTALGGFSTSAIFPLKIYQTYAFRNASKPSISATAVQSTAATSWTLPGITTVNEGSLVLFAIGNDRDADSTSNVSGYTNTNLANITELHDETVSLGLGGGIAFVSAEDALPSATGTTSCTSASSNTAAFITFAIGPTIIRANPGTYSYTGTAATLTYAPPSTYTLSAAAGSYSYAGTAADLKYTRMFAAGSGVYAYSGTPATLTYFTGLNNILLGSSTVSSVKLGTTTVTKVYLGTNKVFG